MTVTFCFLGDKIYQCQEGWLHGEGEIQTSRVMEMLILKTGVIGTFWAQEQGCKQKEDPCLAVTFDTKVYRHLRETSGPAGSYEVEGWPRMMG